MKIIGSGRYECPYCHTVVELEADDIHSWWSVKYYTCPECGETPHIAGKAFDRWLCPHDIEGKKAIPR